MARIEFKPPSDFVADDDGGGSKRSIWKWLGIGCGVIALIIGGLLAAGAWKTVSCCNEAMDSARLTAEAGTFSTEFAASLAAGEVEAARAKMTDELQSKISDAQLRDQLAQHERFFEASPPRLSDISIEKRATDAPTFWSMTVEFAPPAGNEKLVVLTEVVSRGEDDAREFLVDDLRFDQRSRDIASEPPAVEVLDFHRQIRGGNYEQAYRHMSSDFTQRSNLDSFRSFVRDQEEVFRTGRVGIESVAYSGEGRAVIVAQVTTDDERVQVEYELVRPNPGMPKWLISSVSPTYDTASVAADDRDADADADAGSDSPQESSAATDAAPPEPANE